MHQWGCRLAFGVDHLCDVAQRRGERAAIQAHTCVKVTHVINHDSEQEVPMLEPSLVDQCYAEYNKRMSSPFDKQPTVPPPEEEASSEQSSCLAATVDAGHLPRFDFSVWGSYSHRVAKKVALMGVIITRNGEFRSVETKGPADFSTWLSSWKVLHRAFIT